jgi:hypothetical protein
MDKIKEFIERILNVNPLTQKKEENEYLLTEILGCRIQYEFNKKNNQKAKFVVIGKLLDYFFKKILTKYNVNTDKGICIEYFGNKIYLNPDGIDDEYIYEIKKINFFNSNDYKALPERYLLQSTAYMKYLNRNKTIFIILSDEGVYFIEFSLQEEYINKLNELFEKFFNHQPNTNECKYCPFSKKCQYFVDNTEYIDGLKVYKATFFLPQKGYLKKGERMWYFEEVKKND